jgi:hypothetical protein
MNIPKHVAGIALFIFIAAVSIFIVGIVTAPLQMIPPVSVASPAQDGIDSPDIGYSAQLVSLDFINRKIYTTLTLRRDANEPAPDRLWVNTSVFIPGSPYQSRWGNSVEVRRPFADGDNVRLTVTADCQWCADPSMPRAGYYARVGISTVSANDALYRAAQVEPDIKTTIPVLVQVEQKQRP